MAIESLLGLFERLEFLASGSGVPKGKLFRASGTVPRPAAHANFATIVDGDREASERDMEGQNNPGLAQRGRAAGDKSNSRDEQAKYRLTCDPIP